MPIYITISQQSKPVPHSRTVCICACSLISVFQGKYLATYICYIYYTVGRSIADIAIRPEATYLPRREAPR